MQNISQRAVRAIELFTLHYNCAQSVYAGCAVTEGLSDAERLSLAAPFGGGVAHEGELCGALTGALMALGEFSRVGDELDPVTKRAELYKRSQMLIARFRETFGSVRCADLTGCVLSTEEGARNFKERGLRIGLCKGIVAAAAELVDQELGELSGETDLRQLN